MTTSWSATPPTGSPQDYPHSPTDAVNGLLDMIERYRTQLDEMRNNLLSTAGISVTPQGLVADKAMIVNGTLGVTGSTDIDGTLNVDANATFGGTMNVTGNATFSGNLDVPNGSISNAALQSPVTSGTGNASATTGITTAWANYATVTIPVPAGYTVAQVLGISSLTLPTSQTDELRVDINGSGGPSMLIFNGESAVSYAARFGGLSGGNINVSSQVRSAIGGAGARVIVTSAMVIFYRT